jgi:serine/threonine protein kinase/tetratricopeptide (TPR) repeat protein
MIKCPTCGNDAPDSARSCVVCSTPLPRPTVATAVLTPPFPRYQTTPDAETIAGPPSANPVTTGGGTTNLAPGQTFGQRYQVISLLGVGGMGAVYHVWDSELGLSLALKVIKPDTDPVATQELERRFKRELVLARQVTHTNVIRIHDLGEIDGIKYITMPFVHGTDLAQLLAKEGKLPVPRALGFARQIVSGLRAAHEVGIVHRDLKPANILIDDQEKAVITDFGIARSVDAGTFATAAGAIIGTLAYMAPEQATGKPVDQRADIYAFGLIFSEMLIGKRGSSGGDTALALLIERATHAPPRLHTIDPSIPEPIDAIVAKCLKPDPDERYQTTQELEATLDRLDGTGHGRIEPASPTPKTRSQLLPVSLAILLGLAIGLGGWAYFYQRPPGPPGTPAAHAPVSVLIADFENKANDPVFTGSLEQALTIAVEGASFIATHPRPAAQQVAQRLNPGSPLNEASARLVAQSEGINYVITGEIAASGSGYTLSVRAVDPATGNEAAKEEQNVSSKPDVLRGVQSVAAKLRKALGDTTPESAQRQKEETVTAASLEALKSYATAQDLSSSGRQEQSIEHYRNAIKLDPEFGRAYSGLATVLFNTGRQPEAADLWKKSLSYMDRMTERERYRTLGLWFAGPGASYEQAIENFEKLVAQYPADRAARNNLGFSYFQLLDFPKAMEHGRQAAALYPKNPRFHMNYGIYAVFAGDLKSAEQAARSALELTKTQYRAYLPLAAVAFATSDYAGMRKVYEDMGREAGTVGASMAAHGLADLAMYEGRWAEAEKLLVGGIAADEKAKSAVAQANKLVALAEVHLAQQRTAQAVGAAQEAIALSKQDGVVVPAAFVLLRAGRRADAQAIAVDLGKQFQRRNRAYAAIIEGEIARAAGRFVEAKDALDGSLKFADLWLGRYLLGVIYVEGNQSLSAQAELALADKRRGEATAVFLDDVPSFRYLAPLAYWQGRSQESINSAAAADNYRKFLALRPEGSTDPLAVDARKRLAAMAISR